MYIDRRKVTEVTDAELIEAGFLGDGVPEVVKNAVERARISPYFSYYTLQHLYYLKKNAEKGAAAALTDIVAVDPNDLIVVPPHLISKFERKHYYRGISKVPPEMYYRSDLESNPYPLPSPESTQVKLPTKTAQGIYGTALHSIWDSVTDEIVKELASHGVDDFMLLPARFHTRYEDGRVDVGPAVIWIATQMNSANAEMAREITPRILRILEERGVRDVVVEWHETKLVDYGNMWHTGDEG